MSLDGVTMRAASRRRGPGARSVHRREDGRGEHAGLSRHGLRRLRGAAARALRQPAAAALLRGVPADPRRRVRREPGARRHADPGLGRVRLCDRGRPPRGRRRRDRRPENVNAEPDAADIVVALDRLQACAPKVECGLARRRLVRRRPARRRTAASARASRSARRRRRRRTGRSNGVGRGVGASRQPRRRGPPGLRRHAVRLRRGAGDPGAEGARLPGHLLPVHPDGRAGGQRRCRTRTRTTPRRPASRPIPGAGGSPARRRPATPAASTRPPPPARRSRPSSATPQPSDFDVDDERVELGRRSRTTGACGG